ncbi:RNA-directed DNA polymerase, eukaryota, Reverse transcriptase zinc-binding domain protein [Artemisia annua]|uniref:RNA-directed DNA polymerase, eukaryota, Reverse transcriptase zinc-binding domain protein n=1 Tax=Artemisia annua TaxID=35608 RepID=A0A2U1MU60_ARTAN|nr:RNA-directed DNA polymerase, eukaryota, Reverse transcriptase zinc-binding domain protein [Artemisia annua]
MSGRKRTSNRTIRPPARYWVSIQNTQKNSGRKNGKGVKSMFDGDLNGDEFPGLQSQVSTKPLTANNISNDSELDNHRNDGNVVNDSNDMVNRSNANDANKNASVTQENASSNAETHSENADSSVDSVNVNSCRKMDDTKKDNANVVEKSTLVDILTAKTYDNTLQIVQTEVNENGVEIVVFDEETIELGSKPMIMDEVATKVCMIGIGRLGFARVLAELNAEKQFKDVIEIAYKDKEACTNMIKYVQVECDWQPFRCSHCCVFGHEVERCRMVPKESIVENQGQEQADSNDGFKEVKYKKGRNENFNNNNKRHEQNGLDGQPKNVGYNKKMNGPKQNYNRQEYCTKKNVEVASKPGSNSFAPLEVLDNEMDMELSNQQRMLVNKVLETNDDPTVNEWESWKDLMKEYYRSKKHEINGSKKLTDEEDIVQDLYSTGECLLRNEVEGGELRAKRIERIGEIKNKKRVMCVSKTDRVNCELKELRELERRKTEREFLCVSKTDRVFGKAKRIKRIGEPKLERELCVKNRQSVWEIKELREVNIRGLSTFEKQKEVRNFITEEKLQEYVTNAKDNNKGCRIMFGWDKNLIESWMIHKTKQSMLLLVESICRKTRFFCTIVYASNSGVERRKLWKELGTYKLITSGTAWAIMGDFNVTLEVNEHSNGTSVPANDMIELKNRVEEVEIEDLLSSGFQYTWTKSLKNPKCKTLKKLDRVMVNENFLDNFGTTHSIFLPYIISDHSPAVLVIPKGGSERRKHSE